MGTEAATRMPEVRVDRAACETQRKDRQELSILRPLETCVGDMDLPDHDVFAADQHPNWRALRSLRRI